MQASILRQRIYMYASSVLTVVFFFLAFPQIQVVETSYFFVVPFLVWGVYSKDRKQLLLSAIVTATACWVFILIWLRHVTWIGPLGLGVFCGFFLGGWLFVATVFLRNIINRSSGCRLLNVIGLAALWVVLEWLRGVVFTGFPWLTLSASQWKRPVMLQLAPWTGAYGISFILIFVNLVLALFVIEVFKRFRSEFGRPVVNKSWRLEFYSGVGVFVFLILLFVNSLPKKENREYVFRAGVVQSNTSLDDKWNPDRFQENFDALGDLSYALEEDHPELIIWPESAIPEDYLDHAVVRYWVDKISRSTELPMLVGGLALKEGSWFNALFYVDPNEGLSEEFYAKQRRVPFGEYVPLRGWIPFVNKFVPTSFDISPGLSSIPLEVKSKQGVFKVGGLICYEDIFPYLSRSAVRSGADVLLVVTNNAWYGEEEAAYQHAAHSVLRAVETRRPVIRCGNNGWSGWIDEYGNIRKVILNEEGTIYFKGKGAFDVYRDKSWAGRETFYVKYGDWFPLVCLLMLVPLFIWQYRNSRNETLS